MLVGGCKSPPGPTVAPPPPSYFALAETHNARIAKLQTLNANGVIEIRWRDDRGSHFEQGDMELWLKLPRHVALRVEKLGETLLWLGSDESRYWLFDMIGDEKVLRLGRHEDAGAIDQNNALGVRPLVLLDLLGLTPMPVAETPPPVQFNAQHDAWMIQVQGSGGPMRIYFDRQSLLPKRVEAVSSTDDQATLFSSLRRYESVWQPNMPPLAFPKMPKLVDIASTSDAPASGQFSGGSVKIAIDQMTGQVPAEQLQHVFDLERLRQALRPDRIEEAQ